MTVNGHLRRYMILKKQNQVDKLQKVKLSLQELIIKTQRIKPLNVKYVDGYQQGLKTGIELIDAVTEAPGGKLGQTRKKGSRRKATGPKGNPAS